MSMLNMTSILFAFQVHLAGHAEPKQPGLLPHNGLGGEGEGRIGRCCGAVQPHHAQEAKLLLPHHRDGHLPHGVQAQGPRSHH